MGVPISTWAIKKSFSVDSWTVKFLMQGKRISGFPWKDLPQIEAFNWDIEWRNQASNYGPIKSFKNESTQNHLEICRLPVCQDSLTSIKPNSFSKENPCKSEPVPSETLMTELEIVFLN